MSYLVCYCLRFFRCYTFNFEYIPKEIAMKTNAVSLWRQRWAITVSVAFNLIIVLRIHLEITPMPILQQNVRVRLEKLFFSRFHPYFECCTGVFLRKNLENRRLWTWNFDSCRSAWLAGAHFHMESRISLKF